ncbi:PfkB family carbohydrate kinase [Pacificoceanicola onchidii]|uniref:PfkB family carbohydrate kinase n=1 Tax=Pacificoceanicola onchidii TaxID=2562685 RepID=UPI0010A625F8|nr:PfkB family carbohydrate kinase [Pacificoceanicola onchidii]
MTNAPEILCIGSALWDVIGRTFSDMKPGNDVPGRITRIPGGVALNIAITLGRFGMRPVLLSAIGQDPEGEELIGRCEGFGIDTRHVYRSEDLPTDVYMAVEAPAGLIAAIADAHSLETAGSRILTPLLDGSLGSAEVPYAGQIALDGNLTDRLLTDIAQNPAFAAADLRIAPASPGKAERLRPFLSAKRGTLYVNLEEAGLLCDCSFRSAPEAATKLIERGARRAVVTHGSETCCDATEDALIAERPPQVNVTRITGAGDTFMAAHIAGERRGLSREEALDFALETAAAHVSGEISL